MSNLHDTFGIGLSTYASYLAGNYVEEGQYTYYWALFTVNVRRAAPLHCAIEDPSAHPAPLPATHLRLACLLTDPMRAAR